jgi:hypothetical protein
MDAQEQLVFNSEISVAVIGKGSDFVLIRTGGEIDETATEEAGWRRSARQFPIAPVARATDSPWSVNLY